jgi:hypothetical protein
MRTFVRALLFAASGFLTAIAAVVSAIGILGSASELISGPSHNGLLAFIPLAAIPVTVATGWAAWKLMPPQRGLPH